MREWIIHRCAQKLADWHAGKTQIDPSRRSVRNDIARTLEEVEKEFDGAEDYLDGVEGNELTKLKEEIVEITEDLLHPQ